MAFGLSKKVPNQGGMGKAHVQPVKKSGTPSPAKPAKSETKTTVPPKGTHGTSKGAK